MGSVVMMRTALRVLPGLLLGCCTLAGPAPELDLVPPDRWSQAAPAGEVRESWWRDFEDSGLVAAVDESLQQNRSLRALAEGVWIAEAQARIAGADVWPQLAGAFGAQRQKQVFVGFPIPGSGGKPFERTFTNYGVSLDLVWEADLWGRLRARRDAGHADFAAAMLDLAGARLSLAAQVCKTWFTLAEARQQVELSAANVESYRRTLAIVEQRYRTGARPLIDVRLARSTLLSEEADLERRRHLFDRVRRQLELLLGRYPAGRIEAARLPQLPPAPPAGLPAAILDRRPDLQALGQRVLAAHARFGEARGALYPRIALTASTGTVGNELEDLLDGDFHVWNVLGNLIQPLFQGGRLRAVVDLQDAARQEALQRFADRALQAFGEVETALAAGRLLQGQRDALQKLVQESEGARTIATERYQQGRGSLLELLAAQRSSVTSRSRLLAVRREELVTRVDLHLALGGGFAGEPEEERE